MFLTLSKVNHSFSITEATSGVLCLILQSPVQERLVAAGESPVKNPKDGKDLKSLWRKAEKAGSVISAEEKAQERSHKCVQIWGEGVKRMDQALFRGAQWQEQRHKLRQKKFSMKIRKHFPLWRWLSTDKDFPETNGVSLLGDIHKLSGYDPRQVYLGVQAWHQGVLHQMTSSFLPTPTILLICYIY